MGSLIRFSVLGLNHQGCPKGRVNNVPAVSLSARPSLDAESLGVAGSGFQPTLPKLIMAVMGRLTSLIVGGPWYRVPVSPGRLTR